MKKVYIITLLTLLISILATGQNLVVNGNLESWDDANNPSSWTTKQNITKDSLYVHEGNYSASQTSPSSSNKKLNQLIEGIVPGHTYQISFWYLDNSDSAKTRLWSSWKDDNDDWVNDHDNVLHWSNYTEDNAEWQQFSTELVAPSNASKFNFEVRTYKQSGNSGGKIYFDEFIIEDITSASPIIAITSPEDAYLTSSTSLEIEFNILNFNVAESGSGDGHITYALDGNETQKYDTNPISLNNLTVGEHQFIIKLVDDANEDLSPSVADTLNFEVFSSEGVNLLLNGNVELWADASTLNDWDKAENVTQESDNVYEGSYSAKQTVDGTKDLMQDINIVPGHIYEVKYYYYDNDTNAKTRIYGGFRNNEGWTGSDVFRPSSFSANQDAWVEFYAIETAPEDASTFRLEVRAYNEGNGGGSVFYDGFSIRDLTDPGTPQPSITISSPQNNYQTGETAFDITFYVANFEVSEVGSGDGHIAYALDSNETQKYNTDAIALTDLSIGEHQFIIKLVNDANEDLSPSVADTLNFEILDNVSPQATIAITTPQNNYHTTETAFDIEFNVENFNVAEVGSGDGHIAYAIDGNETQKYNTDAIALTDLGIGEHQFIIKLVDDANEDLSPNVADTLNFTILENVAGGNMLINGDVESWTATNSLDSWSKTENIVQESANVHGGNYSAKQTADGVKDLSQDITIIPGHTYEVKYYYYDNDPNAKTRIYGGFRNENGWVGSDVFRLNSYSGDQDAWVEFSTIETAPEDANLFRFEVRVYNEGEGGGSVFYDDFSLIDLTLVGCSPINSSSVKVYPNPAKNTVRIEGESISEIQILDINSTVLKMITEYNDIQSIDISNLKQGIYLIKIKKLNEVSVSRLIKL